MTETPKSGMTLQETVDLHTELIRGTLETLLGACEAGQEQEGNINELASFVLDVEDRVSKAETSLKLQAAASLDVIEASRGMLKRIDALESQKRADQEVIKDLREQNLKLHVANIEIRQVLYGQMTLEEWDAKTES